MDQLDQVIDKEVQRFLYNLERDGKITSKDHERITLKVTSGIKSRITDKNVSNPIKNGIKKAINSNNWNYIVEAFWQDIIFGTGGIRGRAVLNETDLKNFAKKGLECRNIERAQYNK